MAIKQPDTSTPETIDKYDRTLLIYQFLWFSMALSLGFLMILRIRFHPFDFDQHNVPNYARIFILATLITWIGCLVASLATTSYLTCHLSYLRRLGLLYLTFATHLIAVTLSYVWAMGYNFELPSEISIYLMIATMILCGFMIFIVWRDYQTSRGKQKTGLCPTCDYSLYALICNNCPECGADVTDAKSQMQENQLPSEQRPKRTTLLHAPSITIASTMLSIGLIMTSFIVDFWTDYPMLGHRAVAAEITEAIRAGDYGKLKTRFGIPDHYLFRLKNSIPPSSRIEIGSIYRAGEYVQYPSNRIVWPTLTGNEVLFHVDSPSDGATIVFEYRHAGSRITGVLTD